MSDLLSGICDDFQKRLVCYEKDHPDTHWVINVCEGPHDISIANGSLSAMMGMLGATIYALAEDMDGDTVENCIDLTDKLSRTTVTGAKVKEAGKKGGKSAILKALLRELADELDD